jgi:hypothetical protein
MEKRSVFLISGFALVFLSLVALGCSGSGNPGCEDGAFLRITTTPNPATAYSNGTDTIKITVSGQDEMCNTLEGSDVELRITDQSPANVGVFATNDSATIIVRMTQFGASTNIKSSVAGTAKVVGFNADFNLSAAPVNITFEVPPVTGQCAVDLAVDPSVIEPDGISTSAITATLTNDTGGAMPDGTTVQFTTNLGEFVQSGTTEHTTTSSGSVATATLQSEELTQDANATVTATFVCDDADQTNTANSEVVRFGQLNNPSVNLSSSSGSVFADNVSSAVLTAEVRLPGGILAGAGVEVDFYTDLGRFQESTENPPIHHIAFTNDQGVATATFIGGTQQGEATISAGVYIDEKNAFDEVTVNVRALGNLLFVSADPLRLGVQGSGRDESSRLVFALRDTNDAPFPAGALVTFTNSSSGGVTLDPLTDRTDDNGQVVTTLNAGRQATTVTVTATAQVGAVELSAVSTPIAIVGAKPNARFMNFSCETYNVGGFELDLIETECTVALGDRYSNVIGFETEVTFRIEAGTITGVATTEEDGADMGLATTSARTQTPDPLDVDPNPGEPFVGTNNPRDGLVTIIATTTGEEEFNDLNGDGNYTAGEPFVDLGEPFVDENDDGIHQPLEPFTDANNNGSYDGPNGVWDSDTLIWDEAWIVWTGGVAFGDPETDCGLPSGNRYSVLCPPSFGILPLTSLEFTWEVKDSNLNPMNHSCKVDVSVDGRGSEGASSPELSHTVPDMLQGNWPNCGGGSCGWVIVEGSTDPDGTAEPGSVELSINWRDTVGGGATHNEVIVSTGIFY